MRPIVSSPFPRWIANWETQLVGGRKVYGTAWPGEREIVEQSFTCTVWEGCWATETSDSLCAWAMSKGSGVSPNVPTDSGASPKAFTERRQAVAVLVAKALPHLMEAGVPMVVALRAMASAIQAIHRSRGMATFAAAWADERLALGFLHGALKAEWIGEGASPCEVSNLPSSLRALQRRFGVGNSQFAAMAVELDCVFCDAELSVGEGRLCGLP